MGKYDMIIKLGPSFILTRIIYKGKLTMLNHADSDLFLLLWHYMINLGCNIFQGFIFTYNSQLALLYGPKNHLKSSTLYMKSLK